MLAVLESLVKLLAFIAVGLFAWSQVVTVCGGSAFADSAPPVSV